MSEAEILKWIILAIFGIAGWFVRRTVDNLEQDVRDGKREIQYVKDNYLHKDDFKDFKTELRGMFEEIKKDIRSLKEH